MSSLFLPLICVICSFSAFASASLYAFNSQVSGSLAVTGKTTITSNLEIGGVDYIFPSLAPSAGDVLAASASGIESNLSWKSISLNTAGSSVSLVYNSKSFLLNGLKSGQGISLTANDGDITISSSVSIASSPDSTGASLLQGTFPSFQIAGLKAGAGIEISGPVDGDVTISASASSALLAWPIGSIYISTSPTNPSVLFGGTWTEYAQGKTLIGRNSEGVFSVSGSTGGNLSATLTSSNLPPHTHKGPLPQHSHETYFSSAPAFGTGTSVITPVGSVIESPGTVNSPIPPVVTNCTDCGGEAFSILPPYIVVAIWQRIA